MAAGRVRTRVSAAGSTVCHTSGAWALLALSCACGHAQRIPPADDQPHLEPELVGVWHEVQKGETLWRIARAYGVGVQDLAELNGLFRPEDLAAGTRLFVPGAAKALAVGPPPAGAPPEPAPASPAAGEKLLWPVEGVLYSHFGVRDGTRHDGIDIAAPEGTPVVAAAAGRVAFAGEQRGYGKLLLLEHPGGLVTVYAHVQEILVAAGAQVAAGQMVARVGRSGRASGPHLHFEVREGVKPRDPVGFLP